MTRWRMARWIALAGSLGLAVACADDGPLGLETGEPVPSSALFGGGTGLVSCVPMGTAEATGVFGPEGGTLLIGPHTLSIPAGALSGPVTISAVAPHGPVNRIAFSPGGLTFQQPASLTMSHANCGFLAGLLPKRIAYLGEWAGLGGLDILELLTSTDDLLSRRVTASLNHFSSYAIAW